MRKQTLLVVFLLVYSLSTANACQGDLFYSVEENLEKFLAKKSYSETLLARSGHENEYPLVLKVQVDKYIGSFELPHKVPYFRFKHNLFLAKVEESLGKTSFNDAYVIIKEPAGVYASCPMWPLKAGMSGYIMAKLDGSERVGGWP